ncbi:MAG: ABC transporter permease [Planctomycetota bacterium]
MPWLLLVKNLFSHPVRSALTLGSLVIATFLICFLRAVLFSLESGVQSAATNRLMVQSAVSLFVDLPLSYQTKIEAVPGVADCCKLQWFGGIYQDPSNFFAQFAVDADRFFKAYPEVELIQGTAEAFTQQRTACLVGVKLAERFGWKVGDKVPLQGTIFPMSSGAAWDFEVAGIYRSRSANVDEATMWFHFDYLDEALAAGAATGPRGVGVFVLGLAGGAPVERVSRQVDELFQNGPQRVQTTTEAEFQRQFVSMLGSVPTFLTTIGGGVLFAILLAVLNTMLLAARERTRDLGVLKALGFRDGVVAGMLLAESLLLCAIGGAIGVGIAKASEHALGSALSRIIPTYAVTPEIVLLGLGLALGVGFLAGIVPALQANRLRVVEALRAEA